MRCKTGDVPLFWAHSLSLQHEETQLAVVKSQSNTESQSNTVWLQHELQHISTYGVWTRLVCFLIARKTRLPFPHSRSAGDHCLDLGSHTRTLPLSPLDCNTYICEVYPPYHISLDYPPPSRPLRWSGSRLGFGPSSCWLPWPLFI